MSGRWAVVWPAFWMLCGCSVAPVSVITEHDLRTPLEKAAQAGNAAEVRRLLHSGADPNDREGVFGAPLNAAAIRPHNAEVIAALLAAGANPNGRGREGNKSWAPPLYHAAVYSDVENTRMLLEAGANPNHPQLVAGWFKPEIISLLMTHGFDLLAVDELGRNALHLALAPPAMPQTVAVEFLIRSAVPVNARDRNGRTPLAYWREPRDFEKHWARAWLAERLSKGAEFPEQRSRRAAISRVLQDAGAGL